MTHLDAARIREALPAALETRLSQLEVLAKVDSTNSYLMQQPGPPVGEMCVAVTDNQTAGRGRYGRTWQSPPGSGLCLSLARTFATQPANLPALTLATGIGVVGVLHELDFADVKLKWPNDLVAAGGKLGGILTEAQTQPGAAVTVVTGIGINIDLGAADNRLSPVLENDWASHIVDLIGLSAKLPCRNRLTAMLIARWCEVLVEYEASGLANFTRQWDDHDWLRGRAIAVDTATERLAGIGAGIADDGALLIQTAGGGTQRVTSGTVTMAAACRGDA